MPSIENLVGKRFGSLTVMELVGRKDRSATWLCVCDCGRHKIAKAIYLKKGVTKSCGNRVECEHAWRLLNMHQDIKGLRFNRLIVVERVRTKLGPRWRCACDCGGEAYTTATKLKSNHTSSCGCLVRQKASERTGERRYNWKGGRFLDRHGYVKVLMPGHHRSNRRGYVYEHLVVMENKLGRRLIAKENVHHVNGNKADNSPENLELWSTSQPKGQRVKDKVDYAVKILTEYADEKLVSELLSKIKFAKQMKNNQVVTA